MRTSTSVALCAGALAAVSLSGLPSADAASGIDLAMSGSVVAGVTSAQPGQEIAFTFTMKNRSTATANDIAFNYTYSNGTADMSDYICPETSTHLNINPDTPGCETGALAGGKSAASGILVTAPTLGTLTVTACAQDLTATAPDPVTSNNCKTLKVPIK